MDEEMILLDNVMPVEIALKRELEYRRKVEALRKQPLNDFNSEILPLKQHSELTFGTKIASSTELFDLEGPLPSLAGTKRKTLSDNIQSLCSLQPSSSHQAFQKQPAGLVCVGCKATFSTLYYLKQHCASQAHKDKLLQMKKWGAAISNSLLCELCNAPSSSIITLEGHLSGIRHAAAVQGLESAKLGREGEAKLQIFNEKHWN